MIELLPDRKVRFVNRLENGEPEVDEVVVGLDLILEAKRCFDKNYSSKNVEIIGAKGNLALVGGTVLSRKEVEQTVNML